MISEEFTNFQMSKFNEEPYDFHDIDNPQAMRMGGGGSDISAHLPLLKFLAKQCNHVTEFGVRTCRSTVAFLAGAKEKIVSYDIEINDDIRHLQQIEKPCEWEFIIHDTSDENLEIEETDILFIDTLHTYDQVKAELAHHYRVRKYIILHDTWAQAYQSRDLIGDNDQGIWPAVEEFLADNPGWRIGYQVKFNHGLTLLERSW